MMDQAVETAEFKVNSKVRVIPEDATGEIVEIKPGNGVRPLEYRIKADKEGTLSRNHWRAEHLELIAEQEKLEV